MHIHHRCMHARYMKHERKLVKQTTPQIIQIIQDNDVLPNQSSCVYLVLPIVAAVADDGGLVVLAVTGPADPSLLPDHTLAILRLSLALEPRNQGGLYVVYGV